MKNNRETVHDYKNIEINISIITALTKKDDWSFLSLFLSLSLSLSLSVL